MIYGTVKKFMAMDICRLGRCQAFIEEVDKVVESRQRKGNECFCHRQEYGVFDYQPEKVLEVDDLSFLHFGRELFGPRPINAIIKDGGIYPFAEFFVFFE